MEIYSKIKHLAKKKGVTIKQLEKDLGLSERNMCKWNESLPRVDTLKKVAEYFDVPVDYLFF